MSSSVVLGKGKAAMNVSPIGYGCMGITAFYGERTEDEKAIEVMRKAYDLGVRHFDTAQIYTRTEGDITYHNEDIVGKFLSTLSDEEKKEVTVATKFNPLYPRPLKRFDNESFRKSVEKSRERLGVDCIDLFYFHRIFPAETSPVEEWMGAAKQLVEDGLVKRIGLSEANAKVIRAAHKVYPITCIQQEWSIFARDLEESVLPTCKELGIGVVSYSPIGRGFLAGKFSTEKKPDASSSQWPYLSEENLANNLQVLEEITAMAESKGCSKSQLCIAWLVAQGAVPIPGTTKESHLEDNMGALNVSLNAKEIKKLGDLGNRVAGKRGPEWYMKATFHTNSL